MFNPLRLFRRRENTEEDSITAYIEGRATAADEERLRERAENEPGLLEDLDSIRQTVSLLRSAEPVRAPRSFALSEAPARSPVRAAKRTSRRMALAPAVLAVMAATGVGLLTAGDLTNVVDQSGSDTSQTSLNEKSPDIDLHLATSPASSTAEAETMAGQATPQGETALATPDRANAMAGATATTTSAQVPEPVPTSTVVADAGATAGSAEAGATALPQTGAGAEGQPSKITESGPDSSGPDSRFSATDTTPAEPSAQITVLSDDGRLPADDDSVSLPLWQMQAAFGALAVVMAGLWLFLRRRVSA